VAKKWGKRRKSTPVVVPQAFEAAFAARPQARPSAPRAGRAPASSTPLADQLSGDAPGVSENYVVLPRSLAENMPLPWQQQLAGLLAQFQETHRNLSWPTYRVVPSRPERLVDLDEEQLAEAGYLVELDADGEMVYRDRTGRRVENPEETVALVPCLDPIARRADDGAAGQDKPGVAPMNIGPQPVWRATGSAPASPTPSGQAAPPLPPPPTAPTLAPPPQSATPAPAANVAPSPTPSAGEPGWAEELASASTLSTTPGPSASVDTPTPPEARPDAGGRSGSDDTAPPEFGPTGDEPTEIPYRFRR
jgi:hypothetical protein